MVDDAQGDVALVQQPPLAIQVVLGRPEVRLSTSLLSLGVAPLLRQGHVAQLAHRLLRGRERGLCGPELRAAEVGLRAARLLGLGEAVAGLLKRDLGVLDSGFSVLDLELRVDASLVDSGQGAGLVSSSLLENRAGLLRIDVRDHVPCLDRGALLHGERDDLAASLGLHVHARERHEYAGGRGREQQVALFDRRIAILDFCSAARAAGHRPNGGDGQQRDPATDEPTLHSATSPGSGWPVTSLSRTSAISRS